LAAALRGAFTNFLNKNDSFFAGLHAPILMNMLPRRITAMSRFSNSRTTVFISATFLLIAGLFSTAGMSRAKDNAANAAPPAPSVDVVIEWNQKAEAAVVEAKIYPFVGGRTMSLVHVAMFDAINSIEGRYSPYKVRVSAPTGSSAEAAGVAAAHAVLVKLFPEQKASLDAGYVASLAQIPDGSGKTAGISAGEEVAGKILGLRAADGADAPNSYRPSTAPGAYVPTTLPIASQWGNVTPWVMERGSQFRPAAPPDLKSAEWARDYNEVKDLGGKKSTTRTAEQTETARFWTVTGPQSWDSLARQLAGAPGRSLIQNARLFALVEMAGADAYISVFDAKYTFNLWRPITAIRNGDTDGNDATTRDAAWEPLLDTPLHPEYPCAHCITSAAARAVLESEFGTGPVSLSMTSSAVPGVTHKWTSIEEWANEVSMARIYGGIHYRNSTVVGKDMGRKIGDLAVKNYLKPAH
jgi:hypothetical protein